MNFQKYSASGATATVSVTTLRAEQVLAKGDIEAALMMMCETDVSRSAKLQMKAILHMRKAKYAEAESVLKTLRERECDQAQVHKMQGDCAYLQCRYEEAEREYAEALRLRPDDPEIVHDLGVAVVSQGRSEESLQYFRRSCEMVPARADFHHHYAIMLVLAGRYLEGWEEMEWRMQCSGVTGTYPMPERYWNGQPLVGRTIALRSEQGFGDTIMFARYIPALWARGAKRIYFYCQQEMIEWVRAEYPGVEPWPNKAPPPLDIDRHVNVMSLPRHFPGQFFTRPARAAGTAGRGVGFCWFGSPTHKADHLRTVPIERFIELKDATDEPWYCVAYGRFYEGQGPKPEHINYLIDNCWDWADTAKKIASLRLIITVDTAIAHLAGHMGVPCWLLLPYVPDFRWGMGPGETTPWYESVKLYRQPKLFDWDSVFARVRSDLEALREKAAA